MDESSARTILESLRTERVKAEAAAAEAARRSSALQKLIEGYLELFPSLGTAGPGTHEANTSGTDTNGGADDRPTAEGGARSGPKGGEAILRVLSDPRFRGQHWTVNKVTKELAGRGWTPQSEVPANAVRAALRRLSDQDNRVMRGTGANGALVYYFSSGPDDLPKFAGDRPRLPSRTEDASAPLEPPPEPGAMTLEHTSSDGSATQEAPMAS